MVAENARHELFSFTSVDMAGNLQASPRAEIFYTQRKAHIIIDELVPPPRLGQITLPSRLQTASDGGLHTSVRRVAGCPYSINSASHADVTASSQLPLQLEHSTRVGQWLIITKCAAALTAALEFRNFRRAN